MQNQRVAALTPPELLALLEKQGIAYGLQEHPAFFTVAESKAFDDRIPGAHCRNLFLRDDKKTRLFLVSLRNATALDLKKLAAALGVKRVSFGSPDLLWEYLGVKPGSVCPYAILNDHDRAVTLVLEKGMLDEDLVNFHPLINTMTISVKPADLMKLLDSQGIVPISLDMTGLAPDMTA
jgi:Ala-tRNA(Pro) deacylase